jgi:hypothetical protein
MKFIIQIFHAEEKHRRLADLFASAAATISTRLSHATG